MAVVKSIAASFGDWQEIDGYSESMEVRWDVLLADGFRRFSRSERNITQLALDAAERALAAWGGERTGIDVCMFFTDAISDFGSGADRNDLLLHHAERKELFDGLATLGITHAYPSGTWLAGCSNAIVAMQGAQNLVDAGIAASVLVLGADRAPRGQTRIQGRPEIPFGIRSDAGVAFIVERSGSGIVAVNSAVAGSLNIIRAYELQRHGEYMLGMQQALTVLRTKFDSRSDTKVGEFPVVTCANYLSAAVATYLMPCGLALDRLRLPTKAANGHCVCADIVLNVEALLGHHDQVIALSPSAFGWMLVSFRSVDT